MDTTNIVLLVSGFLIGFAIGFVIAARIYYFSPAARRFRETQARNDKRSKLIEQELDNFFKK